MATPSINYIQQPEPYGCGIAVIAMIMGKTYWEVKEYFEDKTIGPRTGVTFDTFKEILFQNGYLTFHIFKTIVHLQKPREIWPPLPFAPYHWVTVLNPNRSSHAILWMADGTVYDPFISGKRSLSQYSEITMVMGVWKAIDLIFDSIPASRKQEVAEMLRNEIPFLFPEQ